MFKIMEVMYYKENYFTLKYKKHIITIKKYPNIFDMCYYNDNLHITVFKKIKFEIPFKYSTLEEFTKDD